MRNEEIATRYSGVEEPFVLSGIATDFHRPFLSRRSFVSHVFPTMASPSPSFSLSRRCRGQHRLIRKLCGKERKEEGVHAVGSSLHYSKRPSRETRRACRKTSECKLLTTRERAKCRSMSREIINDRARRIFSSEN